LYLPPGDFFHGGGAAEENLGLFSKGIFWTPLLYLPRFFFRPKGGYNRGVMVLEISTSGGVYNRGVQKFSVGKQAIFFFGGFAAI